MITADGRRFLKTYLAGGDGSAIGAISIGIGNAAESFNDSRLQFEFFRVPVELTQFDFGADQLVVKGTFPEEAAGKVYEVAIWTSEVNATAGNAGSTLIASFSPEETWTTDTFDFDKYRIGSESLKHTPGASLSTSSMMVDLLLDLIEYSSADTFTFAYEVENNNTASIELRFRTDSDNYYKHTITNPTIGYKFDTFLKGNAVAVGTPDWGNIAEVEIITTSKSSGSSSVLFDGIRLEDVDSVAPEYGLIARSVLVTPIVKEAGTVQDIEYALDVDI